MAIVFDECCPRIKKISDAGAFENISIFSNKKWKESKFFLMAWVEKTVGMELPRSGFVSVHRNTFYVSF